MTHQFSSIIAWSWLVLCCCYLTFAAEADQRYTTSRSGRGRFESLRGKAHLAYNTSSASKAAVSSLFAKYGQNGTLSFEGFTHLLESLGLVHNVSEQHSVRESFELHATDDHKHSETSPHLKHHEHDHKHEHHDHADHKAHGGADDVPDSDIKNEVVHEHHTPSTVCISCLSSKVNCCASIPVAYLRKFVSQNCENLG